MVKARRAFPSDTIYALWSSYLPNAVSFPLKWNAAPWRATSIFSWHLFGQNSDHGCLTQMKGACGHIVLFLRCEYSGVNTHCRLLYYMIRSAYEKWEANQRFNLLWSCKPFEMDWKLNDGKKSSWYGWFFLFMKGC